MTRLNFKDLSFGLLMVLLLDGFSSAAGEDFFINPWQIRAVNLPYENLNAAVGDSITFFWPLTQSQTVSINPEGSCDAKGSILIGDSSPVSYTFTESDAGNTALGNPIFFADNSDGLCDTMSFVVEVAFPPTPSPSPSPTTPAPTYSPTDAPSVSATVAQTATPSTSPTENPSLTPTTSAPTNSPTIRPSQSPSTSAPTTSPSVSASSTPSASPTSPPTGPPTGPPINDPTSAPTILNQQPSNQPSKESSSTPTGAATGSPTQEPTPSPTAPPTKEPTMSPTKEVVEPTMSPTKEVVEPTESPNSGELTPTDAPGEKISETLTELVMGLAGIIDLTTNARLQWQELTEQHSTSHVFNDMKDSVNNFVTSFEVTDVSLFDNTGSTRRMMRGQRRRSRGLQEEQEQQDIVLVTYTQTVSYITVNGTKFTPEFMATAPFSTNEDRGAYVQLLKGSSNPVLAQVKGVSKIQVPAQQPPSPDPDPGNDKGQGLSKPAIIGIACGGAGLLIVIILFAIYCRSGNSDRDDDKSSGDPPLHVDVKNDEISTLAGPDGPPTYGDQSVATVDYDYSKAYGGAGDTSVSSAGGTFGSNTQNISFPANAAATGAALGAMDDNSYDARYDNPRAGGNEEIIHIFAPPGKLGVVIDTPDDGAPVVHAVKDTSVIADRIIVGDKLVAVDDEDVRSMTAIKVSKMISRKGANPSRKLTIVRTSPIED